MISHIYQILREIYFQVFFESLIYRVPAIFLINWENKVTLNGDSIIEFDRCLKKVRGVSSFRIREIERTSKIEIYIILELVISKNITET